MGGATFIRGEIESPRPLRMRDGRIEVAGWCLDGDDRVPPVRLVTPETIFLASERIVRPDLGGLPCGFVVLGQHRPGIFLARFEAQRCDGTWETFRVFALWVDSPPPTCVIESPLQSGGLDRPARLSGWVVCAEREIDSAELRYGNRRVPIDLSIVRSDVAALFPESPHAAQCGFMTRENLPSGTGHLRARLHLVDGSTAIADTALDISIPPDSPAEERIDWAAPPFALRPSLRAAQPRRDTPVDPPHTVLFLLPGTFASNHAIHVANLANQLAERGHACAVAVSGDLETINRLPSPKFSALTHADAPRYLFPNGRAAEIVHVWTTRECVRQLGTTLHATQNCSLVVHLEDNELQLLAKELRRSPADLLEMSDEELDRLTPPSLSHPHRARLFLQLADGVTVINDRLREFVPTRTRCLTLWPAADDHHFYPREQPADFRRLLLDSPAATIVVYPGNAHAANAEEMRELYLAIDLLNKSGTPTTLIRTGVDTVDFLQRGEEAVREHVIELGLIHHHSHLPPLLALADFFVQPGVPDAFNDYRFPSKLPEFFALGRPVILPRTNLGEKVRHGVDAYVLDRADAAGIADAVRTLRADPALAARLAAGATAFAAEHFSWPRSAHALANFYATLATS